MDKHLLMMAALSCAATTSWAADNEPVDSIRTYELQGVQVTSTRAGKKTPMAFSTLTQKQIKQVNFGQDIPYILSLTPSVTTTSDAGNGIGYTSIRVRGVDPSRINITANGVPVNDAESSQVYFVNMADFASSVQSMQIQRGAGTSTNGAGAFGATLNMQTENIGTQPYIGLDASAGSYYSHKETLRFGTGLLGGHWGLQGRLSNIGSKGYLDRASTKLNSYFLQAGYFTDNTMVKFLTFNGTERTYHAWNYASKYEQSLYGRRYNSCGEYYDDKGNVHYYKDQTDNYHQMNYQAIWNQLYGQNWSSNVTLHYTYGYGYYNEYKSNKDYRDYGLSDTKFKSDLTRKKLMENNLYGMVASINYDNKSNYKATLGGGWNKYVGDHWGEVLWTKDKVNTFYPGYEYYRNRAWKSDFNLYTKESWTFLPGLNAYIDLQYRHVGYRMQDPRDYYIDEDRTKGYWAHDDFDFFNPKFGINYQLDSHNRLYASYAISHKEPTRNDYQDNEVQHLKAEKLQDVEFGYRYESQKFTAGANFYYMYYNHQYVLTGELNDIGEMKASNENSGRSYREGVELEAAWKPVDWFRWDANATLSRNICKDWTVTLKDGSAASLGDTHTAFSPDFIFNNIFTFNYKGFNAGIQSQYIGKQYLTNTDFDSYKNYNKDGSFDQDVDMFLKAHFNTNVNLSYHFALPCFGLKDITLGVTLYNIFNAKYDNNGWAAPSFRKDSKGNVEAYCTDDLYEAGFAPSAPFNWMAHLSINF
ncbi:TonB-dependent receptor [Hallella absiana]|uniref:TonB-dependent receptor n=1 Tax=Hallella absiana TaxID=2925336 RepID=UPI0021CAE23B|nr:TonB-dependent receptor [Hallella absiana]